MQHVRDRAYATAFSTAGRRGNEHQPVGDRCGRTRRNVDIVESRRNGPQLSTRYDDDDDDDFLRACVCIVLSQDS